MAIYAILGSTGNCGSSLIKVLLATKEDAQIHAYCRNKSKLRAHLPEVIDNPRVRIFDGDLHDVDLITSCIRGCKAVFLVASTNINVPKLSTSQDTVTVTIAALQRLKVEQERAANKNTNAAIQVKLPKVLLLSSASVDEDLSKATPRFVHALLWTALSNVYADAAAAEKLLRAEESWITASYMKPGGLAPGKALGHRLSLSRDKEPGFMGYLDLAAGMVEVADEEDAWQWTGKSVCVLPAEGSEPLPMPPGTMLTLFTGILRHFLPFLHRFLPSTM